MPYLVFQEKKYPFNTADFDNLEAMAIEAAMGCTYFEWAQKLDSGDIKAATAALWMTLRRDGQDVAFHQVKFKLNEISFEQDEEQLAAVKKAEEEANPPKAATGRARGGRSPKPEPSTS